MVAGGAGVHPVLNAEGNPTVTLALTSFVAPLLFWSGGTLLLLRVVGRAVRRGGAAAAGCCGRCSVPAASWPAGRSRARAAAASRAIVVLALAVSFATSVLMFDATYRQQQRVDAELTLGADLKAVPPAPVDRRGRRPARRARASRPRPRSSTASSTSGRRRRTCWRSIAATPAGASRRWPTVLPGHDRGRRDGGPAAQPGRDPRLGRDREPTTASCPATGSGSASRTPRAPSGRSTSTMAGIALEFPTAPKDAFLVANLGVRRRADRQ